MKTLGCLLLVLGMAVVLTAGCEPTKKDEPVSTEVKAAAYPEGQTPALEPPPVTVMPPVTKEVLPPSTKTKTPPEKTKITPPPVEKTKITPPPVTKTKLPTGAKEYKVVKGDTLSGIAKKVYNDATLWKKIADANKDKVHDKDKIVIGETLVIPAK
jgi:nucleoid-associated protein YgaU